MAVSQEDVLRVAALARLELAGGEADRLRRDLEDILSHVEALGGIDHRSSIIDHRASGTGHRASGIEHPSSAAAPLRDDEPGGDPLSGGPGDFAPAFRDGFFVVPRLASHEDGGAGA